MKNNNTNIKNKHYLTKTIAVLLSLSLAISGLNVSIARADQSPALKVVNDDAADEARTLLGLIKECVSTGLILLIFELILMQQKKTTWGILDPRIMS